MAFDKASYQALINAAAGLLAPIRATIDLVPDPPGGAVTTTAALAQLVSASIETSNPELTTDLGGLHEIPFGYIVDGCYARAHIMNEILGDHGLANGKIFLFGHLSARNSLFPRGVHWGYHVAPLVPVDDGAGVELRVVDPAIDKTPLLPETWMRTIDPARSAVEVRVVDRNQYYPRGRYPTFDESLDSARATLRRYAAKIGGHLRLAEGTVSMSPTHTHVGVPIAVDRQAMTVTFNDSAVLYTIVAPAQADALESAMRADADVFVEAEPSTGRLIAVG
jgi:hypothetical protein